MMFEIPCRYKAAEGCAARALHLEPKLIKARCRRGVARKMNLRLATIGTFIASCLHAHQKSLRLNALTIHDCPDLAVYNELKKALDETTVLMRQRNEDDSVLKEDHLPAYFYSKLDPILVGLEGNGVPCKLYNRDSCTQRADCRFSHARHVQT